MARGAFSAILLLDISVGGEIPRLSSFSKGILAVSKIRIAGGTTVVISAGQAMLKSVAGLTPLIH